MPIKFSEFVNDQSPLYKNARGFLQLGIKNAINDRANEDAEFIYMTSFIISYTGLLLLLKSILENSVDDKNKRTVLSQQIIFTWEEDSVCWASKGSKTVDKDTLLERLSNRGFSVENIKNEIKSLSDARNTVEHYVSKNYVKLEDASLVKNGSWMQHIFVLKGVGVIYIELLIKKVI